MKLVIFTLIAGLTGVVCGSQPRPRKTTKSAPKKGRTDVGPNVAAFIAAKHCNKATAKKR